MSICPVPGCVKPSKAKKGGYCGAHHRRLWKTGDVQAEKPLREVGKRVTCQHEDRAHLARGKCASCYQAWYTREGHARDQKAARMARHNLKRFYGMSIGDLVDMYERQHGRCAICGVPRPMRGRDCLVVDHQHESGEVRGLLCQTCNKGLGLFRDDPDILRAAGAYLERTVSDCL